MMMCIQNLVLFCQFVLKIWSKNRILTSIKGSNSVANLQKKPTKIYKTNIDLVNDNVFKKFGLIMSPPEGLGDILFFPGRLSVHLSVRLSVCLS